MGPASSNTCLVGFSKVARGLVGGVGKGADGSPLPAVPDALRSAEGATGGAPWFSRWAFAAAASIAKLSCSANRAWSLTKRVKFPSVATGSGR